MKAQKNEMRQLTDSSRHTQVRCGTGQKVIGVTRGQLTRARIRVLQVGRREYVRRCRGQHRTPVLVMILRTAIQTAATASMLPNP